MNDDVPFPFIIGSPRSGTTLLRAMLDSHPLLTVPPESYFVGELARDLARYERPEGFAVEPFTADLLAHPRFQRWEIPDADLRQALATPPPADFADAIRRVFALYAERVGKPRYADKTPRYSLDVDRLARVFPEARFVHVIRDGRDVAVSILQQEWGPDNVVRSALSWRNRVETARLAGQALGDERYMEVRYEALIEDPRSSLDPVCSFLALEFDSAMFGYVERVEELTGPGFHKRSNERLGLPPTKGLRDWRTEMSPADVATFELLAGDLLEELGYGRAAPAPAEGDADATARIGPHVPELIAEIERLRRHVRRFHRRAQNAERRRQEADRRLAEARGGPRREPGSPDRVSRVGRRAARMLRARRR